GSAIALRDAKCAASRYNTLRSLNARQSPCFGFRVSSFGFSSRGCANEVDEAALDVDLAESDPQRRADFHAWRRVDQLAFGWRLQQAHPRPLVRRAGDEGVEGFAEVSRQEQRGGGLAYLPFHLAGRIFLGGAMGRERSQLGVGVGRRR